MSYQTIEDINSIKDEDEDKPKLPPDTVAILEEFLLQKNERKKQEVFEEDWVCFIQILNQNFSNYKI